MYFKHLANVHATEPCPYTVPGGIVFYANYFKFFERACTKWLRELSGGIFVVTDAQLRYHRPARLDDALIVTAALQSAGRASLTIMQQALLKPEQITEYDRALLTEGTVRIGWSMPPPCVLHEYPALF